MIDIGANLTDKAFRNDLEQVVERALANGIEKVLVTGTTVEESVKAKSLVKNYPDALAFTAGVHPHHADTFSDRTLLELEKIIASKPVAIGETGLDFYRDISSRDNQRRAFQAQLEFASSCQLPVFIHDRESNGEVGRFIERHATTQVVVHCFTGTEEVLSDYLNLGCYIGITGWVCDERRGSSVAELVPLIPDSRLLIETDAPYLLPRNMNTKPRNRRNEPMYLKYVLEKVAALRRQSVELVDELTTNNAKRLFGL